MNMLANLRVLPHMHLLKQEVKLLSTSPCCGLLVIASRTHANKTLYYAALTFLLHKFNNFKSFVTFALWFPPVICSSFTLSLLKFREQSTA